MSGDFDFKRLGKRKTVKMNGNLVELIVPRRSISIEQAEKNIRKILIGR